MRPREIFMDTDRRTLMLKIAPALIIGGGSLAIPTIAHADDDSLDEQGIQEGMEYIESIPDDALQDQASFDAWKGNAMEGRDLQATSAGAVGCGIAITVAVASNVFVVSKVLKIRAAIKAAGGAKKFADLVITGYKVGRAEGKSAGQAIEFAAQEAAKVGGKDALGAILDVLSVSAVATECFGVDL